MTAPIVIAGAGVGGLTAGLALAQAGKKILILERAAEIEEIGAGLQIAPNAGRALAQLGLESELNDFGLEPQAINIRDNNARLLARLDLSVARQRWGAPFRLFHRADLQQLLLNKVSSRPGVTIETNARLENFETIKTGVTLKYEGVAGGVALAALGLVGADGLRSIVRDRMMNTPMDALSYAGSVAWRALAPADEVYEVFRRRESNLWLLPGGHVVHYPLRDGKIINIVVILDARLDEDGEKQIDGDTLRKRVISHGAAFELADLISAAPLWRRWPFFIRPMLTTWTQDSVTLLGDAAHPMLPFLAQGAAQAIEDALALGQAFAAPNITVERAFLAYEQKRRMQAQKVVAASRQQGQYFHLSGGLALARNIAIRLLGGKGMLARNAWLYR
ncbi:MAG: salicylate 1-monooxygenase [Methylocystaceae bacterium]|nr:salicylate 1-monooxygenase [Methylocystaceae bacterium]